MLNSYLVDVHVPVHSCTYTNTLIFRGKRWEVEVTSTDDIKIRNLLNLNIQISVRVNERIFSQASGEGGKHI